MKLFKKIAKKWYFPWLVGGVVLRLIISPITAHSDLWSLFIAQNLFVFKKVLNIYDYLAYLPKDNPIAAHYGVNFFTYPPLTYFLFGFFGFIFRPFLSFKNFEWILANYPNIYGKARILATIFIFKLPYLIFDLGTAFLLADLFSDFKKKKMAFIFWLFNPVLLYASFMVGQFEVIPVFFSVLSVWFILKKRKKTAGAISLGIGGAFKMYPLLLLPWLALLGKNWKEKIKLGLAGIFPYFLTILPFLSSPAFRSVSLFSSQSQKMLHMVFPVSGAEGVFVFVFLYFFLFWKAFFENMKEERLCYYWLVILLLFFSLTHYHPQWFLWLTPFLIWEIVKNNFKYSLLVLTFLASWLIITLFFEPSLSYGLFIPLFPRLKNVPSLSELVSPWYNVFQLKSLVRSLFAGTALFYSWMLLKNPNAKKT